MTELVQSCPGLLDFEADFSSGRGAHARCVVHGPQRRHQVSSANEAFASFVSIRGAYQAVLQGEQRRRRTGRDADFRIDVFDVIADGFLSNAQFARYLPIGKAACDETQDLYFT